MYEQVKFFNLAESQFPHTSAKNEKKMHWIIEKS